MIEPRIYVASLSDYNNGILHGAWIELDDIEQVREDVAKMLSESPTTKKYGDPAEEYAIHDYEGFYDLRLSEYANLDGLVTLANNLSSHGEAFAVWCGVTGENYGTEEHFFDEFRGEWSSPEEFTESLAEDLGMIPKDAAWPANHIDWSSAWRELTYDGYCSESLSNGAVAIFGPY